MYLVTSNEMREIDRNAIEEIGIPSEILMENAGIAVAKRIKEWLRKESCSKVIILSGRSNNGGDGFVIARHLGNAGYNVETWLIGDKEKLSRESSLHFHALVNSGYKVEVLEEDSLYILKEKMFSSDVIVDALIGIGTSGPLKQPIKDIVDYANTLDKFKVAVDMPTGIICDTGQIENSAFLASITITFAFPKLGHFLYPGADYVGGLIIEDISIPPTIINEITLNKRLITYAMVMDILPVRSKNTHKGTYGHALIVGGSKDMPGAPALATRAALQIGVGLATIAIPKSLQSMVFSYLPEAICMGLAENDSGHFTPEGIEILLNQETKFNAICYGVGAGLWEDGYAILEKIFNNSRIPVILDADGLNALSKDLDILRNRDYPIILTPHPGEMARLINKTIEYVEKNRILVAQEMANKYGVFVVLKGANTVIATPDGEVYINHLGGPELAKGGTGDVLAGMVTGLIAQGIPVKEAIIASVYLHGMAGFLAVSHSTNYSILATDIIENIGPAIYNIVANRVNRY